MIALASLLLIPALQAAPGGGGAGTDLCTNAPQVSLSSGDIITLSGDNTNATPTNDFDPASIFFPFGAPVMWHSFTTTECMNVTLGYCGQDPVWATTWGFLFTSCPANEAIFPTTLNDVDCGDGNTTYGHAALPAGTYYVPVLLLPADNAVGPYTITLSATACSSGGANDLCGNVEPVPLMTGGSLTLTGDNSGATADGDFVPGSVYTGAPVTWHAFTTTSCTNITVSYCGQSPAWTNALGTLMTTCPGDENNAVPLSAFDNTSCGDGNLTYQFNEVPAGTYYVPVLLDPGNNAVGPYEILVSTTSCGFPDNDQCQGLVPEMLYAGVTLVFAGDNSAATATNDFVEGSVYTGAPVTWHAFTTTACSEITVDYCGQVPAWGNALGTLMTTCPGDENFAVGTSAFDNTTCGDGNLTYTFVDVEPGTYYLPVLNDPGNNASGPYEVTVTAVLCDPLSVRGPSVAALTIFPNPAEGAFTLMNGGPVPVTHVEILDVSGRLVAMHQMRILPQAGHQISTAGLVEGVYVVRITNALQQRHEQRLYVR
jgi:hypothetical protein